MAEITPPPASATSGKPADAKPPARLSKALGATYSVEDMLHVPAPSPDDWIVENLIRRGDQVLLAGPPKSGKSLLALQLGLLASMGGNVPVHGNKDKAPYMFANNAELQGDQSTPAPGNALRIKVKRKVLYVCLEMGLTSASLRLQRQLKGLGYKLSTEPEVCANPSVKGLGLIHVFEFPPRREADGAPRRSLELVVQDTTAEYRTSGGPALKRGDDFLALQKLVETTEADLVILDTLIQLHQLNENDNIGMKAVMSAIRAACTRTIDGLKNQPVAHVILHHKRKDQGQSRGDNGSAESMRGAGSIHSEADLALTLRFANYSSSALIMETSAREVSVEDRYLTLDESHLLFRSEPKRHSETNVYSKVLAAVFQSFLSNEQFSDKHPDGFKKSDAAEWLNEQGPGIAKAQKWEEDFSLTVESTANMLNSLVEMKLLGCNHSPGKNSGGRGKSTVYLFSKKTTISIDSLNTALRGFQFQRRNRRKKLTKN